MGSGARARSACAPESAAHRPLRPGFGSVFERSARPWRATSDPRACSEGARRSAFSSADGRKSKKCLSHTCNRKHL
eukprot:bmy_17998T0